MCGGIMDETKNLNSETVPQSSSNPELDQARTLTELKNQITNLENENKNLQEAKSKYYDAVLNGTSSPVAEKKHRSIGEIRGDLIKSLDHDVTNLDYCTLAVELDNAVREDAEKHNKMDSVFLPHGKDIQPTVDEYNTATKINSVLQDCIDKADGDPERFNMELSSRMSKR